MWLLKSYKGLYMRNFAAESHMDNEENIRKLKKKKKKLKE